MNDLILPVASIEWHKPIFGVKRERKQEVASLEEFWKTKAETRKYFWSGQKQPRGNMLVKHTAQFGGALL